MARPVVVPPTRRSRIPVRSMIHSSLVSSVPSRSTLVTTLSGIADAPAGDAGAAGGHADHLAGRGRGAAAGDERFTEPSRGAEPRDRLAPREPLAGDGQHALDGAAERGADLVAGHVADDAAALDVLALGDVVGGGEHAGGGADDHPLGGEEVLAVVVLHGADRGGGLDGVVEVGRLGDRLGGGVGRAALGHAR